MDQHRRYNPLTGDWVLVSPHRLQRPWKGQVEKSDNEIPEKLDSANPLCPGICRPNGQRNPDYTGTYLFHNDFPALLDNDSKPDDSQPTHDHELLRSEPVFGACDVLCFHPKSDITLPLMSLSEITAVIDKWAEVMSDYAKKYTWVQIFENKGSIMGCSNPHPHCQIWSSSFLPTEPSKKNRMQKNYYDNHQIPLLIDYIKLEKERQIRVVIENDSWICVVPYWAVWPYETMLVPKRHVLRFYDLNEKERTDLAEIMKILLTKYDNLFGVSFPYSMGWHGAPTGSFLNENCDHWQLHALYYPPLLRSSTVKKFMVGYEMLAEAQRDITAEQAAATLRQISDLHYKPKSE